MSKTYIQIGTYNDHSQDHSKHVTVTVPAGTNVADIVRTFMADDVEPVCEDITPDSPSVTSEFDSDISDSIIFTKKAKKEGKIPAIIDALRKSMQRRRDKSRALVEELAFWQKDEYVDAHYNARVMYDELAKLIPLSFGYEVFKKYYNNTI